MAFIRYLGQDGGNEIYTMNPDGSGLTRLTENSGTDQDPAFSPNGKKIAFTSARNGGDGWDVMVMDADGSNPINLTPNLGEDNIQPAWSPNGKKIVFVHSPGSRPDADLYVMDADGSNIAPLAEDVPGGGAYDPEWSPDGSKISFMNLTNEPQLPDIWVINSDGSGQMNLTNDPDTTEDDSVSDQFPSWSPDGTKIAFDSTRDGQAEVYTMNPDGTDVMRLTNGERTTSVQPAWSPDGTKIAFASGPEILTIDVDDSNETPVYSDPLSNGEVDWQPTDNHRPSGSVTINSGRRSTSQRTVKLTLEATDPAPGFGVNRMRIRNAGRAWSGWRSYIQSTDWNVTRATGKKTVYVQFKDRAGNVSATASDSITYRP
jgi:Tol biopolymer transport system component